MKNEPKSIRYTTLNRRLAKLSSGEDMLYGKMFAEYMNNHQHPSPLRADAYAWKELCKQYPRLNKYDGALP